MPNIDFFDFFRYLLATIATVYATVITLQSLWGWVVYLSGSDKYIALVRRYVIVQGLRLRFRTFWGDVLVCLLLCVVFLILWRAHGLIYQVQRRLDQLRPGQPHIAKVNHVVRGV
jgi:hypothetical protein